MEYGLQLARIVGSHVLWGPAVFWPLSSFAVAFVWTWLAGRRSAAAAPRAEEHWSEVARWAQGRRSAVVMTGVSVGTLAGVLAYCACSPLGPLGSVITIASVVAAVVGTRLAFRRRYPVLVPERTRGERLASLALGPGTLYYWALTPLLWVPFVSGRFDAQTWGVVVVAVAFHFAWAFVALRLWGRLGLVRAAPPELEERWKAMTRARGVELRGVRVWRVPWANAFALPVGREIAVTERLLELLDPEQLDGVILHELTHLGEPRGALLVRVAYPLLPLLFLLLPAALGSFGWLGLVLVLGTIVVATKAFGRFTRQAEVHADEGAHGDESSLPYAAALLALHRDRLIPAVMRAKASGSHPELYDRLLAAGFTPDFPRPQPPPRTSVLGPWVLLVMCFSAGFGVLRAGIASAVTPDDIGAAAWCVTPPPDELIRLDLVTDSPAARALAQLGMQHAPTAWNYRARAWGLTASGRCEEARALVADYNGASGSATHVAVDLPSEEVLTRCTPVDEWE